MENNNTTTPALCEGKPKYVEQKRQKPVRTSAALAAKAQCSTVGSSSAATAEARGIGFEDLPYYTLPLRNLIDKMRKSPLTVDEIADAKSYFDLKLGAVLVMQRALRSACDDIKLNSRQEVQTEELKEPAKEAQPSMPEKQIRTLKVDYEDEASFCETCGDVKMCFCCRCETWVCLKCGHNCQLPSMYTEFRVPRVLSLCRRQTPNTDNFVCLPCVFRCVYCKKFYTKFERDNFDICECGTEDSPIKTKERLFEGWPVSEYEFNKLRQQRIKISETSTQKEIEDYYRRFDPPTVPFGRGTPKIATKKKKQAVKRSDDRLRAYAATFSDMASAGIESPVKKSRIEITWLPAKDLKFNSSPVELHERPFEDWPLIRRCAGCATPYEAECEVCACGKPLPMTTDQRSVNGMVYTKFDYYTTFETPFLDIGERQINDFTDILSEECVAWAADNKVEGGVQPKKRLTQAQRRMRREAKVAAQSPEMFQIPDRQVPLAQLTGVGKGSHFANTAARNEVVTAGYLNSQGNKFVDQGTFQAMRDDYLKERSKLKKPDKRRSVAVLRAQAADSVPIDTFSCTGHSKYLKSIFLPDLGAVSMPDDVMRLHHTKTETVTYNLTVGDSGAGVIFLYPNHPTNLVGYHYVKTLTGYAFDRSLLTAQDLKENYDFCKRSSQLVTIRSSTIPSGVYALNGTFNAVRIDGFITEIPDLQSPDLYNSILTNTPKALDKVGNVLVGDGVAIISLLDSFNQPYTRLGDVTPNSIAVGRYTATPPAIIDRSDDLQYSAKAVLGPTTATIPAGTVTPILDTTFNIDSNTGVQLNISISGDAVTDSAMQSTVIVTYLDVLGNVLFTDTLSQDQVALNGNIDWVYFSFNALQSGAANQGFTLGPLGAIRIQASFVNPTVITPVGATFVTTFVATVPTGARSGVNGPINVVAYQGVAPGSVLTVSGWTNVQAVPNPSLRQNMPTNYSPIDPGDAQWAKVVLSDRDRFELRSVWNLKDYELKRPLLAELADTTIHERAQAMSFGDVIGTLKRTFAPLAKSALRAGLKELASHPFIGAAASGDLVSRAASGSAIGMRGFAADYTVNVPRLDLPRQRVETLEKRAYAADEKVRAMAAGRKRLVSQRNDRIITFPVLVMHPDAERPLATRLYAASTVNISNFRPDFRSQSNSGYYVQGLDRAHCDIPLNCNVYLFPVKVDAFAQSEKIIPEQGPIVGGHSCDAAIWLACHGKFDGVLPFPITGAQNGPLLEENEFFAQKQAFLREHGLPLAGNDEAADIIVENLDRVNHNTVARAQFRTI